MNGEMKGINTSIKTANKFLGNVCKILKVPSPKVKEACLNSYVPYTIYRGVFVEKDNTIYIANDYDFKNKQDYEKAIKHEIAEYFCFVIRKNVLQRVVFSHGEDKLTL